MKVTFILPSIEKKDNQKRMTSWRIEPLPIAQLAGLTPDNVEIQFFDDRFEDIRYDEVTNLAAITVNTYTAKRAYNISSEYRKRNIPVVLGGCHPTLVPEEAAEYADSVVVGEAEDIWGQVIKDAKNNTLKKIYRSDVRPSLSNIKPRRDIFEGKRYLYPAWVEFGRGCNFRCDFCTASSMHNYTHNHRPVKDVIEEIRNIGKREVFFADDNIIANREKARELFEALIPLRINWAAQSTINFVNDSHMLDLMVRSGCKNLFLGFESLAKKNLELMNKTCNLPFVHYESALRTIRKSGIRIWASFILGYDFDTLRSFEETFNFAMKERFLFAGFNKLVPYPGTPLYARLLEENRLLYDKWWLAQEFKFEQTMFKPKNFTPEQLADMCYSLRLKFISYSSIFKRSLDFRANCRNLSNVLSFLFCNFVIRREIKEKQGMYYLGL